MVVELAGDLISFTDRLVYIGLKGPAAGKSAGSGGKAGGEKGVLMLAPKNSPLSMLKMGSNRSGSSVSLG